MADIQQVLSASSLVHSGAGVLQGLVACVSHSAANGTLTCYDNTAASGSVLFKVEIEADSQPFALFFPERFAPRFSTGLYLALDADMLVNVWATGR